MLEHSFSQDGASNLLGLTSRWVESLIDSVKPEAHNKKTWKRRGKLSEAGVLGNKIKKGEKNGGGAWGHISHSTKIFVQKSKVVGSYCGQW